MISPLKVTDGNLLWKRFAPKSESPCEVKRSPLQFFRTLYSPTKRGWIHVSQCIMESTGREKEQENTSEYQVMVEEIFLILLLLSSVDHSRVLEISTLGMSSRSHFQNLQYICSKIKDQWSKIRNQRSLNRSTSWIVQGSLSIPSAWLVAFPFPFFSLFDVLCPLPFNHIPAPCSGRRGEWMCGGAEILITFITVSKWTHRLMDHGFSKMLNQKYVFL